MIVGPRARARAARVRGAQKRVPSFLSFAPFAFATLNSLVDPNVASLLAEALNPGNCTADIASVADGADGITPTFYLNRAQNAGVNGLRQRLFLVPTGTTSVTMTFEAKLPTGVSSGTITCGITDAGSTAWKNTSGAPVNCALTSSWQTFTVSASGLSGATEYRDSFSVNYTAGGATAQARVLIRNKRVTPNNGTGIFASNFYRVELTPSQLYDYCTDTRVHSANAILYPRAMRGPSLARAKLNVNGASSVVVEGVSTLLTQSATYTNQTPWSVYQGGSYVASATPTEGQLSLASFSLSGSGLVDIVGGSFGYNSGSGTSILLHGSTITAVYVPGSTAPTKALWSGPMIVGKGNSIPSGWYATPSSQHAYFHLARMALQMPFAMETWGTGTLVGQETVAQMAAAIASYGVAGHGNIILNELGVNDWGTGGVLTPSSTSAVFGTTLGSLMDTVHTADPSIRWVEQTMIHCVNETVANANGDNMAAFITQKSNDVTARPGWAFLINGQVQILTAVPASGDQIHPNDAQHQTMGPAEVTALQALAIGVR